MFQPEIVAEFKETMNAIRERKLKKHESQMDRIKNERLIIWQVKGGVCRSIISR